MDLIYSFPLGILLDVHVQEYNPLSAMMSRD